MPAEHRYERRRAWARALTIVVLAGVGGMSLVLALHGPDETSHAPTAASPREVTSPSATPSKSRKPTSPKPTSPKPAPVPAPAGQPGQPVHLSIPAIDVSARVTQLGLQPDRTVEVPSDPATTGWYRLGPLPGDRGSAVILGHVDSMQGPAVFYQLRFLHPGDLVTVGAADGSTVRFRVTALATYRNEDFPASKVYGPHGDAHDLQLVTCGGQYNSQTGYQSNVVVYTTLVGATGAAA